MTMTIDEAQAGERAARVRLALLQEKLPVAARAVAEAQAHRAAMIRRAAMSGDADLPRIREAGDQIDIAEATQTILRETIAGAEGALTKAEAATWDARIVAASDKRRDAQATLKAAEAAAHVAIAAHKDAIEAEAGAQRAVNALHHEKQNWVNYVRERATRAG